MKNLKKFIDKITIISCIVLIFGILGYTNVHAADTGQKIIKINNTTLTFNDIIYVDSKTGNDETADGSISKPFVSVDKAIYKAKNGDAVFIKAGKYHLTPMYSDSYTSSGIFDLNKELTIIGENEKTILEFYGNEVTKSRDANAFEIVNPKSKVMNLSYNYYPGKGANYSNSIFVACSGSFYNLFIHVKGDIPCSYSYFNNNPSNKPEIRNCVFKLDKSPSSDYSGSPYYINCVTNYSFNNGEKKNCLVQELKWESIEQLKLNKEVVDKGIGVYSGEFAWETVESGINFNTVLYVEPEKSKIRTNETISSNLAIDNIKDIAAEDVRIKYDKDKLQFINVEEVDGIKLVKDDKKEGELRFIVASKGEKNIANSKKALLKLNFKGIKPGEANVDVVKGRISDGIEMERDLKDEECGKAKILIEELKDVNNSGEFTLLDLAIDARHMGKDPKSAELAKYNTDIVQNNAIDDADLLEIGKFMLENPNYKF